MKRKILVLGMVLGMALLLTGSANASWLKGKLRIGLEGDILSVYPTALATVETSSFTSYEIMPGVMAYNTMTMYIYPTLQNFWQTFVRAEYSFLPTLDLSLIVGIAGLRANGQMKGTSVMSIPSLGYEVRYRLETEAQYEFPGVHFVYGGGAKFCYPINKVCSVGIKGQYLVHNPHQFTFNAPSLRTYDETGTLIYQGSDSGTGELVLTDWEATVFGKFLLPKIPILGTSIFSIGLNYLGLNGKARVFRDPNSPSVEYEMKPSNCWGLEMGAEFEPIKNFKILIESRLLNISLIKISCLYNF